MSFAELLADLQDLQELKKSQNDETDLSVDDDEAPLGKSISVTDEDGNEFDAVDGTELVKSLAARLDERDAEFGVFSEDLTKALTSIKTILTDQSELIKSLNAEITELRGAGRGRKASVTVLDKPTMAKSQPEGMTSDEFMVKAEAAQKDGRILARDVATAEISLQKGIAVPEHIVRRVIG